jgi:putative FmdB family regulatory protein
MPTYDYRCKDCGKTHEIQQGFNDERPTTCPACGGHLARIFHPVGVVFKGSGFHKTDYSGTTSSGRVTETSKGDGASEGSSASSKSESSKSDASSSGTGTSETKPATPKPPAAKSDPKTSGST